MSLLQDVFGLETLSSGSAPGRVNLMGDHTDYNDGFVLPIVIPQRTTVEIAVSDGQSEVFSAAGNVRVAFDADKGIFPDFSAYIGGCVRVLADRGIALPPLKISVRSEVPVGVGLSSSAALEVASLRALNEGFTLGLSDLSIAEIAWLAENTYAGVRCGIMDQIACAMAKSDQMLFLDTRSLNHRLVDLPRNVEIVVVDSGVTRRLAASGYNARRAECDAAAGLLNVSSLRDIQDVTAAALLPFPLNKRVRHVITENARVSDALEADGVSFGQLMNDSHASLRDDYEVSHPVVDTLVRNLQKEPSVFGARITGAGFGGACVAMIRPGTFDRVERVVASVANARVVTSIRS